MSVIPEKLVLNRHSCEGAVGRKRATKADLDIYHRSIQSDPGVGFDFIKFSNEGCYRDNMKRYKRSGNFRPTYFRRCDAGFGDLPPGQARLIQPMINNSAAKSIWYEINDENLKLPNDQFRRRERGSESMHKRVISTSLSSSATSLYSDDDSAGVYLSSSPAPSFNSDCPSVPTHSCRGSICCIEEEADDGVEEEIKETELTKIQQNINNNNVSHDTMTKLNENLTYLNLNNNCQEDKSELSAVKTEKTNDDKSCNNSTSTNSASVCPPKQSRETLVDQELDEYEEFALSDQWLYDNQGQKWARAEGKSPIVEQANSQLKFSIGPVQGENGASQDVYESQQGRRNIDEKNIGDKSQFFVDYDGNPISSGASDKPMSKSKSNNFLKRFGGDFMKLGNLKRDFMQKNDVKGSEQSSGFEKSSNRKSFRKNRKVSIGKPTLQSGQERLEKMKCVPIENSQGLSDGSERKNSIVSSISSSASTSPTTADHSVPGSARHNNPTSTDASASKMILNKENSFFLVPPSHKPGTFPTALRQHSEAEDASVTFSTPSSESSSRSHSASDFHHQSADVAGKKLTRPRSVYDNLDESEHSNFSDELLKLLGVRTLGFADDSGVSSTDSSENHLPGVDLAFWSVDNIVEQTQSLRQLLGCWDSNEDLNDNSRFPLSSEGIQSESSENVSITEDEVEKSALAQKQLASHLQSKWETIKRAGCGQSSGMSTIHSLSADQFMMLRRLAVLKLTSSMEKFNSRSLNSWSVPKFIRRFKEPDYKDKNVFGVPLLHNVQKFGQSIPPCILNAMDYLRRNCFDLTGIFRKPGVRVRIQNLKGLCEENSNLKDFSDFSPFDVADLVKQYFRELPDPLMTVKLSETFIGIFQCLSEEQRLEALQCALILLPDENREALQTLLYFLLDVAANASENQMGSSNLSTCFAPSLFHLQINNTKLTASPSPKLRKSQGGKQLAGTTMKTNVKEMNDNSAATQCLLFMIENIKDIFKIPDDGTTRLRLTVMNQPDDVLSCEIGRKSDNQSFDDYLKDFHSYIDRVVAATLREEQKLSQNKTGSWQNSVGPSGSELMSKKINDGNHLRVWRSSVKIPNSTPEEIFRRITDERNLWDTNLVHSKVLNQHDQNTQLYQSVVKEMPSHLSREYCIMRTWRKEATPRGTIVIVETSTEHTSSSNDVRGVVLTSRYIIDPTDSPKTCTLTRVCRIDAKGRNPEWYNKAYGHVIARNLLKIRDSLRIKILKSSKLVS